MKKRLMGEAGRFVIVGVLATLLHYGLYYVLMGVAWATLAYAVAYALSFVFNFLATSYFTFHVHPTWSRLAGMLGAHGVNFLLHMLLFQLFLWLSVRELLIPVPVYAIAVPVNFFLVRYVFKSLTSQSEKSDI